MSVLRVSLRKTVDDSYDIEIGYELIPRLADYLSQEPFATTRLAVITDTDCARLFGDRMLRDMASRGLTAEQFVFLRAR